MDKKLTLKDDKLNYIIESNVGNIAQFISLSPIKEEKPRHVHISKFTYTEQCELKKLIEILISSSEYKAVNIRSYSEKIMKGNRLIYNKKIDDIEDILRILELNRSEDKYSIINENIDVNDGGVSGVLLGETIEFSPYDTPKCVDKEGVCSLPKEIGLRLLGIVYGFQPEINFDPSYRVEFSIHPNRCGVNHEHTIIWEYEHYNEISNINKITWPNNFSKFIGDKTFGLIIAYLLNLKVPMTTVIARNVPPFAFGDKTGINEKWIRTCPYTKEPGKYFTGDKWVDPFILMNEEEKKGKEKLNISAILSQEAVESIYSGACIIKERAKEDIIEGVSGKGDSFMIGEEGLNKIPKDVLKKIKKINNKIRSQYSTIGEVSIEWVYDGKDVWIVQLNQIKESSTKSIIVKGAPDYYIEFDVKQGLEELRKTISELSNKNIGIELIGNIGITSHFGDLLRLSKVPSKLRTNV